MLQSFLDSYLGVGYIITSGMRMNLNFVPSDQKQMLLVSLVSSSSRWDIMYQILSSVCLLFTLHLSHQCFTRNMQHLHFHCKHNCILRTCCTKKGTTRHQDRIFLRFHLADQLYLFHYTKSSRIGIEGVYNKELNSLHCMHPGFYFRLTGCT